MNNVTGFRCTICGTEYDPGEVEYVCPKHGDAGVLDTVYDYRAIARQASPGQLANMQTSASLNMFRYKPLLPIDLDSEGLPLHVGWTPLYRAPRLEAKLGLLEVWLKDDGRNPTASFKDRASALVVVRAVEERRRIVTTASSGNAGAALAGMAASVKMPTVIFVPQSAPQAKVAQLLIYGARVFLVRGNYDAAFELCLEASKAFGWYCRNTAYNPFTVEGKKTAALEICEQLALSKLQTPNSKPQIWDTPDRIFVSVGDGNIISGLHKGLVDLAELRWIDGMPKLMGVQAEGAAACYRAWSAGADDVLAVSAHTIADSISVDLPRDGRRAIRAVRQTGGGFVTVSDEDILAAMRELAQEAAVFAEPAAAAAYAGLASAVQAGQIGPDERVVVLLTGSGLKDVPAAVKAAPSALVIDPHLDAVRQAIGES
ncbi:MAG TPA: threonine synthase [Anaerolineae bacterium]|nr:threonine synthase [Anaerolineae bacterium]